MSRLPFVLLLALVAGCTAQLPREARVAASPAPQPSPSAPRTARTISPWVRAIAPPPDFQALPLRLPSLPVRRALPPDARILAIEAKNRKYPTFAAYRQLVALHLARGEYDEAVRLYKFQAAWFRREGLTDAATIQDGYAARYTTDARLFFERPSTPADIAQLWRRSPGEPQIGAYLGAFIDRDDHAAGRTGDDTGQWHRPPDDWMRAVGRSHGSLWIYHPYGQRAPLRWLEMCRDKKIVPHLALEPKSMAQVQDDAYLTNFARSLRDLQWPVLIHFASEMNGNWTPCHRDPKLYRERFRLFYRVMHREAPNAAIIWCVANPPADNFDLYYPGDDACDWVGINFYAVPFYENNPKRPAFRDNPLALLDAVYTKYSGRKPIAICEFGVSHQDGREGISRTAFAQEKLALVYGALPLLYPRVKLMDWFSVNTIRNRVPGKTVSNYSLTENPTVLNTYRALTSNDWFLSGFAAPNPPVCAPLTPNTRLPQTARLHLWVKTYTPRPSVYLLAGNTIVYAARRYGPHAIELDTRQLPPNTNTLTMHLYDESGRFITSRRVPVRR